MSIVVVVTTTNDVVNAGNATDLQWSPSNHHIHFHQIAYVPHL
jgi:hypothetical protein